MSETTEVGAENLISPEQKERVERNAINDLKAFKNKMLCIRRHVEEFALNPQTHEHLTMSIRYCDLAIQKIDKKENFWDVINDTVEIEDEPEFKSYDGWKNGDDDVDNVTNSKILYRELRDAILMLNTGLAANTESAKNGGMAVFHAEESACWMIEEMVAASVM
jgi:hypothetical protein